MAPAPNVGTTRDRLLLAAAELMHESGSDRLSTRAVCQRAGVEAPTLYHHFGNKQGLVDAVIQHGFQQYVEPDTIRDQSLDPIDAIRHGWDRHVGFGLDHPRFYALLYGGVERGRPCAITSPALARLTELLDAAARSGRLRVTPAAAAAQILAANVGVTLSLIAQPEDATDLSLSERVREAALAGVLADERSAVGASSSEIRVSAALVLSATLDTVDTLTAGERALLHELLERLAEKPWRGVPQTRASASDRERGAGGRR
jgi:AcrR family transcriptional regulator